MMEYDEVIPAKYLGFNLSHISLDLAAGENFAAVNVAVKSAREWHREL
uniref:Uncharacterized protein n=1 Tax=Rhizophora mucronata TaxID=61149 RepID=A0A2P2Q713_RHIMU